MKKVKCEICGKMFKVFPWKAKKNKRFYCSRKCFYGRYDELAEPITTNYSSLKGKKFGKLIVIKFFGKKNRASQWLCKCECGKETIVYRANLVKGTTKSCGCLKHLPNNLTHGMSYTKFYRVHKSMLNRCNNKNQKSYRDYGERGIKVCNDWNDFNIFYKDMFTSYRRHQKKYGVNNTTLERINNDGGYNLKNCKWATRKEQAQNKRKICKKLTK
jgi:hypothetical protein